MQIVNTYQAKSELSQLITAALAGKDVVIAKAGKPLVRLVPVEKTGVAKPGSLKGKIWMSEDFDRTPEDIVESFYASKIEPAT